MITSPKYQDSQIEPSIFGLVQARVDLHKVYPFTAKARKFDQDYYRDVCIGPDHDDTAASMMVHHDGVYCMACGYARKTLAAAYQALKMRRLERIKATGVDEPFVNIAYLADELLEGDYALEEELEYEEPAQRTIPIQSIQEACIKLWNNPEYLTIVRGFGFTDEAIRHWRLGIKEVPINIAPDGEEPKYEIQTRINFPVFEDGKAIQEVYRKLHDEQLGGKIQVRARFGAKLINRNALKTPGPKIIVEGWGDVIALWQLGFDAVSSTNGAGHWNSAWFEDLGLCLNLWSSGDADAAGEGLIKRVRKNCPWVRPIRPPFELGTKGDWRDFVKAGGTREQILKVMRKGAANAVLDKMRAS